MQLEMEIAKTFPGFGLQVSLACDSGILVLFGPSGAGKSLTLQCLAGIVRPESGRIVAGGRILFDSAAGIDEPPQRRRIGYVPQDYALFPHMTVAANIAFGLRGVDSTTRDRETGRLVELLRLGGLEKRRPAELSGGQQQRVALARALAIGPRLLLLDEPFSALDAPLRDALRSDLCTVQRELGVGIVFVTHGIAETHIMAQTVAVYSAGRVLQVGPPEEVFQRPASVEVARLTGSRNMLAGTVGSAAPSGCWIEVGQARLRAASNTTWPQGSGVVAVVRPECIRFLAEMEPADGAETTVRATVQSVVNQGHVYSVQVAVGGEEGPSLQVLTPVWWWEGNGVQCGDECRLAIPVRSVHLIPLNPACLASGTPVTLLRSRAADGRLSPAR